MTLLMRIVPVLLLISWSAVHAWVPARVEVDVLLDVKAALDPHGEVLVSWQAGGQPCSSGAFEGVLCDAGDNYLVNSFIILCEVAQSCYPCNSTLGSYVFWAEEIEATVVLIVVNLFICLFWEQLGE